jgi:uncharacterized protein YbjT (DUF2867 family)
MNSDKTILVSGATGRQGGAVIKHLTKNNFKVKALSRTPDSLSARKLISEGITVVKGDMSDTTSLIKAMEGCHGVYSIQNYFEYGGEKEILFGKNIADAAKKGNVPHFIFGSVAGAGTDTGVPHFETKYTIEKYIREIGLNATILRPVKFMENYYILQVFKGILGGKLFDAIKPEKRHQIIASDDIGAYVADAFSSPEKYMNQVIEIAGEEMTNDQIAKTMSDVFGHPIKSKSLPMFAAKIFMDKEVYLMYKWFNKVGFNVNIESNIKNFPSVKLTSLKEWLVNENWLRWNKKGVYKIVKTNNQ